MRAGWRAGAAPGLVVRGLAGGPGGARVLDGIDLDVGKGEIVALLGRNGSGRSTLLRALMGLVPATGSARWRGLELVGQPTFRIARAGLGWVPETRDVFPALTVEQNLLVGLRGARPARWSFDDVYRLFPRLGERRATRAGQLSGGEQQMLALGRTLVGDPALMLVDEPTEGLAPRLVEQVAAFIATLRERGVAVLLVEQRLAIALDLADRVALLGHGRVVFDGPPAALSARDDLCRDWLDAAPPGSPIGPQAAS